MDLPADYERSDAWVAWARIDQGPFPDISHHYEITEWLPDQSPQQLAATAGWLVAPVIGLPDPVGFSFPSSIDGLLEEIDRQGFAQTECDDLIRRAEIANRDIEQRTGADDFTLPTILLIGSPASGRTIAPGRIAHFAAWDISLEHPKILGAWPGRYESRRVTWRPVIDQRPQVTIRRDVSRPAHWVTGKRVAILGCGALGAPIAEHCARAGARKLHLTDNDIVKPGILVRQPYAYYEIGRPKAEALAARLRAISPSTEVKASIDDALKLVWEEERLYAFDLIVDATANQSIANRLEFLRRKHDKKFPALVSVMIGHDSSHGVATVALPTASGAGIDILRRLVVGSVGDEDLTDVIDELFPDPPRTDVFQPEPGCSSPTFEGSAVDLAGIGAQLFNGALAHLNYQPNRSDALLPTRTAVVVRQATDLRPHGSTRRLSWPNDIVRVDQHNDYQIRISSAAFGRIRRAIVLAAQERPGCEIGGVLLGQINPACRVVWVDEAPDSAAGITASPGAFHLDMDAVRNLVMERHRETRGMVTFIGTWHTHPGMLPLPSERDLITMRALVAEGPQSLPHALLIVLGWEASSGDAGPSESGQPMMHVQMFFPD